LEIVKSPVTLHLPSEAPKIAFSTQAKLIDLTKFAAKVNNDKPIVIVVGAVAKGNPTMEVDYITDSICISKYALSASVCLGRITYAFEMLYEII
jgi:rRNA small subunit pseudouridine methyltransferase Nep1